MATATPHKITATDPALCSELLERICCSNELKRAARLQEFLRYVGHRSLQAPHQPVSEHEIGVDVFGRQQNYDTSADNIVRVNASELRKRIAAYFAAEGAKEPILVDIPRGSYTPVFSLRPPEPLVEVEAVKPELPQPALDLHTRGAPARTRRLWPQMRGYAAVLLILILAAASIYLFIRNRALEHRFYAWRSEPALGPFWSGILDSPRQTDLVVADTSIALIEDILKQRISLSDYLNHGYVEQLQASDLSPALKNQLLVIASRRNGSLGDFLVAERVLALEPGSPRLHVQYAREFRPDAVQSDNLILIGSSRSNPWCKLFEDRLNFTVGYDLDSNEMLVKNRNPRPGESATYVTPVAPSGSTGFAVIDSIPNDDQSANVLIIAGTTSEATEAAGDFLTSEDSLRSFQEQLKVRRLPYFELLLKTTKLAGTPLAAQIVAYRTFPGHPLGQQ